jgi:excisionase family DNA binding protein
MVKLKLRREVIEEMEKQSMRLLTIGEVAERLSVCRQTIYNRTAAGTLGLPRIRIGRAIRFDPRDLEKIIMESKKT